MDGLGVDALRPQPWCIHHEARRGLVQALSETEIRQDGKCFLVRSWTQAVAVAVVRTVGGRLPHTIRQCDPGEGVPAPPAA